MEILRGKFIKHEYRKHEKGLYLPKTKPELITVPKQKFIMIDGKGDPNSNSFAEKVGALYRKNSYDRFSCTKKQNYC